MITTTQANYLIGLPKKLVEGDTILDDKVISTHEPFRERFYLISEDDDEFSFFLDVWQSPKRTIKFSLHYQEDTANYGLLRIDYNGGHKNPEVANEHVPDAFRPYTGLWLDQYSGHIHYVVDGYKPLAWAIPLEIDSFPIKSVASFADFSNAFKAFCSSINVETNITLQAYLF